MTRQAPLLLLVLVACRDSMNARDFKKALEPKVVTFLCDHDRPAHELPSYYRNCFDVDEAQCTAVMQRKVHACAERLVHGTVDESNAGKLAVRIGACAGSDYERELEGQGKLTRSHACDVARDAYAKDRAANGEP